MRDFRVLALLSAGLLWMAGCGPSLHGKYADSDGALSVEFESGHKALITTALGTTTELSYKVEDDKVILEGPQGNMVLTRAKDGALVNGPFGSTLKKSGL